MFRIAKNLEDADLLDYHAESVFAFQHPYEWLFRLRYREQWDMACTNGKISSPAEASQLATYRESHGITEHEHHVLINGGGVGDAAGSPSAAAF
jgi:hypothetical protein